MSNPKVAIITRTKDRPQFLRRAMESVLNQSMPDWVHIVVNDGGDPSSVEALANAFSGRYRGRLKIVHHKESKGMQNASNAGVEASDSEYLIVHDDDDSWKADFLEVTCSFLDAEGADSVTRGVVTQTTQIFEEINYSGEITYLREQAYYPFALVSMEEMRRHNLFAPIAFLYRRSVHQEVGLFRQEFDVLGDHDFNLRFLRKYDIGVISTFHANYHWRSGSMGNTVTKGLDNHRAMLTRMKNVYYREWMDDSRNSVGSIDEIPLPPPQFSVQIPFRKRHEECPDLEQIPDFLNQYQFDVLSLDVFDTVLKRTVARPKDVFKMIEQSLVDSRSEKFRNFSIVRELAEQSARGFEDKEIKLDDIYSVIGDWLGLGAEELDDLKALELETEKNILYVDPRWVEVVKHCFSQKKKVVFVSDMYLPLDTITSLLEDSGFTDPVVYLSCDLGVSKHQGELYNHVVKNLNVEPEAILHVGDNFYSDWVKAKEFGLQAFHWTSNYVDSTWIKESSKDYFQQDDQLSSQIIGKVQKLNLLKGDPGNLLRKLGREVAGPLYFSFLRWVINDAKKDAIDNLVLIGRDGYYWAKTLDLLGGKEKLGLSYSYLHASRKVLNYASFEELNEDALTFLLTPNPSLCAADFLDRAGLDSSRYIELIKNVGFEDPKEVLTNEMGGKYLNGNSRQKLRSIFIMLRSELERLFANERRGMKVLLKEAGFSASNSAIVDIGWNASSVRSLSRIVDMKESDKIKGYFFGTWKEAEVKSDEPCDVHSYFMHLGQNDDHARLLRESINWIESLNAAPYPTLLSLDITDDGVKPIFSENKDTGFLIDQQKEIWAGAEDFLNEIKTNLVPVSNSDGFIYLYLVLSRLLREPTPHEIKIWGSMTHSEGFGLEVYKQLIEEVSSGMSGPNVLAAYRGSNWKRGFLASLPEHQRNYVVERIGNKQERSYEQLKGDLEWKIKQADEFWAEKEKAKEDVRILRENKENLQRSLNHERTRAHKLENERSELFHKLESERSDWNKNFNQQKVNFEKRIKELENKLENEKLELNEDFNQQKENFEKRIKELESIHEDITAELIRLKAILSKKTETFKALFKRPF